MKTVIQRVKSASVTVDGQLVSSIGKGLLVFAAVGKDDSVKEAESMASKVLKAKFWDDGESKWKKNVQEIDGESAPAAKGKELYDSFFNQVRKLYREDRVKDGVFQAMMDVALVNDGPVTIEIETNPPEMKNPSGLQPPEEGDTLKGHVHKTFELPASLLE